VYPFADGLMRHVEFFDAEIAEVERLIARQMLSCSDARRLMSVPGVNVICAASFPGGDR
jgi:transposase